MRKKNSGEFNWLNELYNLIILIYPSYLSLLLSTGFYYDIYALRHIETAMPFLIIY